jgi:hypothetical protein
VEGRRKKTRHKGEGGRRGEGERVPTCVGDKQECDTQEERRQKGKNQLSLSDMRE